MEDSLRSFKICITEFSEGGNCYESSRTREKHELSDGKDHIIHKQNKYSLNSHPYVL